MGHQRCNFFRRRGYAPEASLSLVSCIHVPHFSNGLVYDDAMLESQAVFRNHPRLFQHTSPQRCQRHHTQCNIPRDTTHTTPRDNTPRDNTPRDNTPRNNTPKETIISLCRQQGRSTSLISLWAFAHDRARGHANQVSKKITYNMYPRIVQKEANVNKNCLGMR